ncbi:MAG: hypothetical protein A2V98_15280 [Planctomycetes bacterium RBG_16_64_12]|nr:MAG: hypothetical protein A2V98_15280 [Planctomycetes bacterium RBG_16_64_12]
MLGILVFGWIFYRIVAILLTPAMLHVGMGFDKAQLILRQQGAKQAWFDVIPRRGQRQFDYYWLATGPAIEIISKTTPTGRIVESMFVSTYAPKSWKSKSDPEYAKFFDSFVRVEEYDLKTKPVDDGGVQGCDLVPGGGRERAARFEFILNCILLGILAITCILGLGTGTMVSEASVGLIRRVLSVMVGLFAMLCIPTFYLNSIQQEIGDAIVVIIGLSTFLLGVYAIFAFSVGVALVLVHL